MADLYESFFPKNQNQPANNNGGSGASGGSSGGGSDLYSSFFPTKAAPVVAPKPGFDIGSAARTAVVGVGNFLKPVNNAIAGVANSPAGGILASLPGGTFLRVYQAPQQQEQLVPSTYAAPVDGKNTHDFLGQTVENGKPVFPGATTISQAPPETVWDKVFSVVKGFTESLPQLTGGESGDKYDIARAQNAFALQATQGEQLYKKRVETIAKENNIPVQQVDDALKAQAKAENKSKYDLLGLGLTELAKPGGNPFRNSTMEDVTKELGISSELSNSEFLDLMMALSLPVSLAAGGGLSLLPGAAADAQGISAIKQLSALGKFTAVSTAFDTAFHALTGKQGVSDLLPEDSPQALRIAVDGLELLGKAYATHGLDKVAPDVRDVLTKRIVTEYKIPRTLEIDAQGVRNINLGLDKTANADFVKQLGMTSTQWRDAVQNGIKIEIPAEKVVTISDRPYWEIIKKVLKIPVSEPKVTTFYAGDPKENLIRGLLPPGDYTPAEVRNKVINSDLEGTPEGAQIIKATIEAQKQGGMIQVGNDASSVQTAFTKATTPPEPQIIDETKLSEPEKQALTSVRDALYSGDAQAAQALHDSYISDGVKVPDFKAIADQVAEVQQKQLDEVTKELKASRDAGNPDDPTQRLLEIADKIGKHFNAPKAIFKITGAERTYTTPQGETLKVGGDTASALDKLFLATDLEGMKNSVKVLADKFDKVFSEINNEIQRGAIDDADYEKFKERLQEYQNRKPTYQLNTAGRGTPVQDGNKQGQPETPSGGNPTTGPNEVAPKIEPGQNNSQGGNQVGSSGEQARSTNKNAQEPVGQGKLRESEAYRKVKERIEEANLDNVNYNILNLEKDTENAMNFVADDPQAALRVAFGLEAPPAGQTETNIAIALADKAYRENKLVLWNELESSRSLRQTRRGQEIVAERGRFNDDSPQHYLREVLDRRLNDIGVSKASDVKGAVLETIGKDGKASESKSAKKRVVAKIDQKVERLSKQLTADQVKIRMAQDIIDALRC